MRSFQLGHQPIANPEKMLLSAVIRCALSDARGQNSVTDDQDVFSALEFLSGDLFVDLCDWLGIQPELRDQAVTDAIGDRPDKVQIHCPLSIFLPHDSLQESNYDNKRFTST